MQKSILPDARAERQQRTATRFANIEQRMADSKSVDRRKFLKICAGAGAAVAASPSLITRAAGELRPGERVRLVDAAGNTFDPTAMTVGRSYVFHYPYVTTPCFLIDLGSPAEPGEDLVTAEGEAYRWSGGVGPTRSIVAFSAICAHKMSYPTRSVSFIDYRHKPMSGDSKGSDWWDRGQVIYCCSEGSVYDPRDGARVMSGPAPQPLAAVSLEFIEEEQALFATGIYGGAMLEQFLEKFGFQVALAHEIDDVWAPATGTAGVWPLDEYSRTGVC
jgi:Rieske Fe-S protein